MEQAVVEAGAPSQAVPATLFVPWTHRVVTWPTRPFTVSMGIANPTPELIPLPATPQGGARAHINYGPCCELIQACCMAPSGGQEWCQETALPDKIA